MGSLQRMMVKEFPYWDINQSKWFRDIAEGCQYAKRHENRIFIYFDSKEKAEKCQEKCERRNINNIGILGDTFYENFRVDIFMNWKERKPSKLKRNQEQILN